MEELQAICKTCKSSYVVEVDGKRFLICDRYQEVVHNKNFCDEWEEAD